MMVHMTTSCIDRKRMRGDVRDNAREFPRIRPISRTTRAPSRAQPGVLIDQYLLSPKFTARDACQD